MQISERAEDSCPGMSVLIQEPVRPKPQIPKPLKLSQNVSPNLNWTSVSVMSWTKAWPQTPMNFGEVQFPVWSWISSLQMSCSRKSRIGYIDKSTNNTSRCSIYRPVDAKMLYSATSRWYLFSEQTCVRPHTPQRINSSGNYLKNCRWGISLCPGVFLTWF